MLLIVIVLCDPSHVSLTSSTSTKLIAVLLTASGNDYLWMSISQGKGMLAIAVCEKFSLKTDQFVGEISRHESKSCQYKYIGTKVP